MKKIPNCSTWNKIKTVFFRFSVCAAFSLSLAFSPLRAALAAPAVVPVAAETVAELLVALGLISHNATSGLYDWRTDSALGQQLYAEDIFGNVVPKLTSGEGATASEVGSLLDTVIPKGVYFTDGNKFYTGGKEITTSDLFLNARALVGVNYDVPTNIVGAASREGIVWGHQYFTARFSASDIGSGKYYIPYVVDDTGAFLFNLGVSAVDNSHYNLIDFSTVGHTVTTYPVISPMEFFIGYPCIPSLPSGYVTFLTASTAFPGANQFKSYSGTHNHSNYRRVSGSGDLSFNYDSVLGSTCLITDTVPQMSIAADSAKLDGALVQVKEDDDKNNSGGSPPAPQSPNQWQLWKTVEDLLTFVETGEPTNGGTTLGDFVNNNYNYVDVDINVPDKIDTNVNLSGGLDINGNGDINVTVHEDISLPSAGDGSGFYNPNAADVVGALNNNNPVISGIKGIFAAIDPALVGVFSVSVSLMLVLGLWKLIRG